MSTYSRHLLVGLALLAVPTASQAQTSTPTITTSAAAAREPLLPPGKVRGKYKTYLYQRYAQDREACAVTHLFGRKQRGGILWLVTGTGAVLWVGSQTGTRESGGGTRTVSVGPLGWGALVGLFGGIGIGKLARFSNERLYQQLLAHDQNFPFPRYVTKRLRDRDNTGTGNTP